MPDNEDSQPGNRHSVVSAISARILDSEHKCPLMRRFRKPGRSAGLQRRQPARGAFGTLKSMHNSADIDYVPKRQGKARVTRKGRTMSHKRFLKILLVVLSLALWAGTANATSPTNFAATDASSNPVTAVSLTYIAGGGGNQSLAGGTITIGLTAGNQDVSDGYTVSATGWPGWLTSLGTGTTNIANGATNNVNIAVNVGSLPANPAYPATYTYTVLFQQNGHANLAIPVTLSLLNSPLTLGPFLPFGAVGSNFTNNNQSFAMRLASPDANFNPTTFALDPATLPAWINPSVTPAPTFSTIYTTGTDITSATVAFALDPGVTPALAPGIYKASVGFTATGYGEYYVPITLSVSNPAPTLLLKEGIDGTVLNRTWSAGANIPIPSVTPYSSLEPIPFNATCTITLSNGGSPATCAATPASSVAYSWGTVVNVPGLLASYFNKIPLGNTVTVAITITPTTGTTPPTTTITYIYTLVPIPATVTGLNPSAVAPLSSNLYSTVVLVQGTGFVSAADVALGSGLGATKVWLGATPASTYAVMSSTLMAVTVPANAMTTIPSGSTSATLAIGVANYSGGVAPSAPTSSYNLTITTGPVVYGLTSAATFKQPTPGNSPNVAAYELISIFGANFMSSATGVSGTLDSYNKFPTTLPISGNGTSAITLTVTFTIGSGKTATTYLAPIIFANSTQINAIVPSGVTVGATPNVTVTTAGSTTVPLAANVVTADPGIYTMGSDGFGQGAILNITSPGGVVTTTVNGLAANGAFVAQAGETISVYATGLGAPDSTGADAITNKSTLFPSGCIAISNTTKGSPGYLQIVNTSATGYTSPKWTSIDGAVITVGSNALLSGLLPPCMQSPVSVVITNAAGATVTLSGNSIGYAGFVSGAVAGLYQINATLPASFTGAFSDGTNITPGTAYPIQVNIGAFSSPSTATIQF